MTCITRWFVFVAKKNQRVRLLRADDISDHSIEYFRSELLINPLHLMVTHQHTNYVVIEKNYDARFNTTLLPQLDGPYVKIADSEGIMSRDLVSKSVTILCDDVRTWLVQMTPRSFAADFSIQVADRDHILVADHYKVVEDKIVREQLEPVTIGE